MARCVKHTRRRIYYNANHARSPLSPVIYRVRFGSREETRDKFSIYEPRNDSNQSPTHRCGSFAWKRPPAKLTNARSRDSDGDLKVSIKRGLPRARHKFLCDRSRISLWSICAPHTRFSLHGRAIGRRKRLSCFTSLALAESPAT